MSDWKTVAAIAGVGAAALWFARSRSEEKSLSENDGLDESFSGLGDVPLPREAPPQMKTIYGILVNNAKKVFETEGEALAHIYWSLDGYRGWNNKFFPREWSVGDAMDSEGFIIGKMIGRRTPPSGVRYIKRGSADIYRYTHRSWGGEERLTLEEAKALAKEFFDYHPDAPLE